MNRRALAAALLGIAVMFASAAFSITPEEATMIANAAGRGDDGAQLLLAVMYLNGDGGRPKDEELAAHWFEEAATQGNAYAQKMLGDLYAQGRGVPKNLKLAAEWREKGANRGNVQAQLDMGKMFLAGEGVEKNADKAEYWLNRAAIEGNSEAQYLLGKRYRLDPGAKGKRELADNLLAKSAAQGYERAIKFLHFMEGQLFHLEEGFYQGAPDLHKLAEDGDTEAQYQLAMRCENGAFGEQQDNEKALYWFRLAAANGHVMAMKSLAHIYKNGLIGTAIDLQQAQYWSEKARESAK